MAELPIVTIAILAKQKAAVLPLYLQCLAEQDYPKHRIHLYVRTNDSTDGTEALLEVWLNSMGHQYRSVKFDNRSCDPSLKDLAIHDWKDRRRFVVLNRLREESVRYAIANGSDYYFIADCDNWILPWTLSSLVRLDAPVVAPLLRHVDPPRYYSNYHHKVSPEGWYVESPEYYPIWAQKWPGLHVVDCVHCTYLVRRDVLPSTYYEDPEYPRLGNRYDYVVFSECLRKLGVPQLLDNREIYGWLTLEEEVGSVPEWIAHAKQIHRQGGRLGYAEFLDIVQRTAQPPEVAPRLELVGAFRQFAVG